MSDSPATAWVCAAIWLGLKARRRTDWAIAAGAALGVAVLVRPTDALALPALWLALPAKKSAVAKAFLGGIPFAALLFFYNLAAFGSAMTTGYGPRLGWTMSLPNALANIRHYGYWIPALLTPVVPLGWMAIGLDRRVSRRDRGLLLLWFGAFLLFYCFYDPYDDWWSTRFLLPGIPAMILATLVVARGLSESLRRRNARTAAPRWPAIAGLTLCGAMVALGVFHIRRFDLLSMRRGEAIYREASLWAFANTPSRSVIVAMQMSGAVKYYTDRLIARWDAIPPARFPALRRTIEERGSRSTRCCGPSKRRISRGTCRGAGSGSARCATSACGGWSEALLCWPAVIIEAR
jgi:4-amino-4-deoxy-L-arabinose transferase-like glycosyltransferase